MRILLDTNILLRLGDSGHPMHGDSLSSLEWLHTHGYACVIVPQNLYEYWVVATRPAQNNGLGMTVAEADAALSRWIGTFRLLLDERGVFANWRHLVSVNDVKGKNAHDARLISAMQRHGVEHLLTFNKPDFARFTDIQVFSPAEVLADKLPTDPN